MMIDGHREPGEQRDEHAATSGTLGAERAIRPRAEASQAGVQVPVDDRRAGEQADEAADCEEWPERHGRLTSLLDADAGHHGHADDRGGEDAGEDRYGHRAAEEQPEDPASLTSPMPIPRG